MKNHRRDWRTRRQDRQENLISKNFCQDTHGEWVEVIMISMFVKL